MPNWCDNIMFISHDDSEMIRSAAMAFNNGTLLDVFYPKPKDAGDSGGYDDWRSEHWGTKGEIQGCSTLFTGLGMRG